MRLQRRGGPTEDANVGQSVPKWTVKGSFFGLTGNRNGRIWLSIRALLRRAANPQEP
jgi:hypothetical protein